MAKEQVEINGIHFEVDMSTAKRIDTFKVGDSVKVLNKDYSDTHIQDGTIIGFYNFKELPTIQVAVFEKGFTTADIKIININKDTKDQQILPSTPDSLDLDKDSVVEAMDNSITEKQHGLDSLRNKRDWFIKYYGKYFEKAEVTEHD
ncbi:MAG: hypothetical protein LKG79_07355 [Furfurilactobacillus sp.]|jgi:hypothetical protein|uniref:hypothetical protein n=1 Tax=Furfurilactobacillus sp. TaxID=2767911 RepID=UPI002585EF4C|nr:hypothetical protein [Furfurilactobacillus sp.]MCH4010563.1 hypothetical protein [Furfurilactobacillus sp.]MCH4036455.1 hypothetical protein [Furfurilactobacillus sp.]MCH4114599.1 hypothetical protein [Furfurilactobacillus sp.]MCH4133782.1 hypothetical protein [Furfurilactobacillus sp.]MCI1340181.1 hypothetical protein [Furfurilactobacillus sp.]